MIDELPEFLQNNKVDIATLTLPKAGAEAVAGVIVENGVRAIWNFAHTDLEVPDGVAVQSVHLSESLMQLSYKINHQ
jgi:redox-sensing transcriptional repressor